MNHWKRFLAIGIMGFGLLIGGAVFAAAPEIKPYEAQDFNRLKGMKGFSNQMLEQHFTLYQGYVTNTNLLLEQLKQTSNRIPAYAEMKRRFGWEFNGMRLHELYFGNLGGNGQILQDSKPLAKLAENFGSFDNWAADFKATGAMRGIGWVVLFADPQSGRLMNCWVNEHDVGLLADCRPLLIMDVFEHAYMPDYNLKKADYIQAFFQNIDWVTVESRLP